VPIVFHRSTSASGSLGKEVTAAEPKLFQQHGRRTRCGIHGSPSRSEVKISDSHQRNADHHKLKRVKNDHTPGYIIPILDDLRIIQAGDDRLPAGADQTDDPAKARSTGR